MASNRKVGTGFEKDLALALAACGFWCHNLTQNSQGQPFDVIAARNGVSYPIDCKVCDRDVFKLERIEENQFSAMSLWLKTGNDDGWFALRMVNGEVYFLPFCFMLGCKAGGKRQLNREEIQTNGIRLSEWVKKCS